jgi:pimeloyl-ACP methyl ester carboxylesterase
MEFNERLTQVNGVELCIATIGHPADPPILLIMGAGGSMLLWEDEFCERLAAASRFVIRYDHRDTGRSVAYEPGAPPYTFRDLVADAAGVVDIVNDERVHAARSRPFEDAARRELAGRVFDRSSNIAARMKNHFVIDGGERWRERLGELTVPTLVMHGAEDPLFAVAHAQALADEIPDAQLLILEEIGHELPRRAWDVVVPAIVRHSAGAGRWGSLRRRSSRRVG